MSMNRFEPDDDNEWCINCKHVGSWSDQWPCSVCDHRKQKEYIESDKERTQ